MTPEDIDFYGHKDIMWDRLNAPSSFKLNKTTTKKPKHEYHSAWLLSPVSLFETAWTVTQPMGSSVHVIHQARILEWVAILFSRGSS